MVLSFFTEVYSLMRAIVVVLLLAAVLVAAKKEGKGARLGVLDPSMVHTPSGPVLKECLHQGPPPYSRSHLHINFVLNNLYFGNHIERGARAEEGADRREPLSTIRKLLRP